MKKQRNRERRWPFLLWLAGMTLIWSAQTQAQLTESGGAISVRGRLECAQWRKDTNSPPAKQAIALSYPDIWSLVPDPARGEKLVGMVLLPDGDVGLKFYNLKENSTRYQRMFFDRPLSEEDQCRIQQNVGMPSIQVKLDDGRVIKNRSGFRSGGCYTGLDNSLAVFSDESMKNKVIQKTFLYVLDKPRHWTPKPNCYEGKPFDYRIVSLGRWQLLPLPDGTFVAAQMLGDSLGIASFVLRLDERLQVKSPLLDKKLFYLPEGFKFSAYSEEGGDHDIGGMQRDLYRHLMDIKAGKMQP